jgi:hypothetical protein
VLRVVSWIVVVFQRGSAFDVAICDLKKSLLTQKTPTLRKTPQVTPRSEIDPAALQAKVIGMKVGI